MSKADEAWKKLTAPMNETVTSKWYFKKGYEAAIASFVLPERKKTRKWVEDYEQHEFDEGYNSCLDEIKRILEGDV